MAVTVKASSDLQLSLRLDSKLGAENPAAFGVKRGYDGADRFFLKPGETYFAGRVVRVRSHTVQVMSDVWADETLVEVALPNGQVEEIILGYSGDAEVTVDATPAVLSKVETYKNVAMKLEQALSKAQAEVDRLKPALRKGGKALAFKGRKVKVGTEVEIFWSGTVRNKFNGCNEHRLGVILPNGDKTWVSADNFEPLPTPAEVAAYGYALKFLDLATVASLEGPKDVGDLGNYEEAKLANREAEEDLRRLMPARVRAREFVRGQDGDEAASEHERLYAAESRQEVQMGDY
jgi:hypothetical protein